MENRLQNEMRYTENNVERKYGNGDNTEGRYHGESVLVTWKGSCIFQKIDGSNIHFVFSKYFFETM